MRGFALSPLTMIIALLLVHAVSGATIPITQMPSLYVSDYGEGVAHDINSYTLEPDQAIASGAWMLLGTNDQTTFARIDARKDISFMAGGAEQFNVANTAPYRWYYLYLQDGFPVGSNVQFHLHQITPPPTPTGIDTPLIDIVIERAPLVVIIDFDGTAMMVDQYNLTSSVNLPAGQSWQLLGTNDPAMLGSDDPGLFTLLDDRSGIGFTSGVPEPFNVTSPGSYLYYVFYLQSGFSVTGMNLEIHLSETPVTPTPTPGGGGVYRPITPVPTPTPLSPPVADFEGNPRAGTLPLPVTFADTSKGPTSSWSWDFGDGQTTTMQSPVHTYTSPGNYTVNFTACNEAGCSWVARASYIYAIPTGTPTPTGTPRYYIKIGGETTGTTSASEEAQASTESAGTGSGTDAGSTGSGSSGSGGGQGSQAGGGTTGPESSVSSPSGQHASSPGIIQAIIAALGDIREGAGSLLDYLVNQLGSRFGH
jgi:PKD repeat protein